MTKFETQLALMLGWQFVIDLDNNNAPAWLHDDVAGLFNSPPKEIVIKQVVNILVQ